VDGWGRYPARLTIGKTDDYSYNILEDAVHVHDLQATIPSLSGN